MGIEVNSLNCNGCGAPLDPPKGAMRRIKCPYCGVENIIKGAETNREILNKENIMGGLQFEMNDPRIHKMVVEMLSMATCPPADVYEACEIKSVNRIIVPAYWFDNCTAMGTAQYEKGVERQYSEVVGSGENMHSETRYRTEWYPMSAAVSAGNDFVVSGNKQYNDIFRVLYANVHSPEMIDIEQLDYPADCAALDYDLPDAVAFNQTVKGMMENEINEKARTSVGNSNVRNLRVDGISVQRGDVRRVSVGIYEIVVGYKGTDYYLYLSNNGGSYAYGNLPNDNDRQAAIEERRQAIKAANTTKRMVLMISLIVLVILGIVTLIFLVGIVFLIAAIPVGIFYYPVEKEYRETKKRLEEEIRAISGEFPVIKQNFINNRVALKGVLSSVSGNPEAF